MATNEYTPTPYHGFKDPERGAKKYLEYISDNIADYDTRIVRKGAKADRPAAGTENRWYLAVDEPAIYYDDGKQWQKVAGTDASGEPISAQEFLAADGSAADPSIAFQNDVDTGLYRPGADTAALVTGGVQALRTTSTQGVVLPNGDLTDGTNTIYDSTNAWVPLSILEANSITLNGGAGLKNGSTAQLGGSFSLDIEPADFAGAFLSDDGTDALQANLGSGVEGDGADNIRVDGATVAGAFLSAGANPYQLAVNLGAFLSGDGADNVQVNLGSMLTGDGTDNITLSLGSGVKDASGSVAVEPADIAGAFLSDDGADALQANLGSGVKGDGADNITVDPADFAGHGLADDGSDNLEIEERVHYEPGHTEWTDGLADEEVKRIVPPTGAAVHIDVLGFYQKGGGSSTSVDVDVYDAGAATELASVNLGSTDRTGYSGGSGNTVLVRVANASGAAVNAEPVVRGRIA